LKEIQSRADSARKLMLDGRARLIQLEERRESLQRDSGALLNEYSEAKSGVDAVRYQLEQANARRTAVAEESGEIERERFAAEEQIRISKAQYTNAVAILADLAAARTSLEQRRDDLRAEIQKA
jgi:chromosome segregation ATPase